MASDPAFSAAWQRVTCSRCGEQYQCTPWRDYYNATSLVDGVCESCLLAAAGISPDKIVYTLGPEGA